MPLLPPVCFPLLQDAFSFGVCMWEMLTFRIPWGDIANPWQVGLALRRGGRKLASCIACRGLLAAHLFLFEAALH